MARKKKHVSASLSVKVIAVRLLSLPREANIGAIEKHASLMLPVPPLIAMDQIGP